jgi:cytochrome P450
LRRAALRPRAEEIAAGLLDELAAAPADVIDLLNAYARPLPIAVLCELLGIPAADRAWIAVTVAAYDERGQHQRVERKLAAYFTLGRDTSGHVAFGHGVHHCLGDPLPRMETEIALGALARFPGLSLAVPPETLRWRPVSLMNGLESLPVCLT